MKEKTKSTIRELVNLTLITGAVIAFVFQFNNPIEKTQASNKNTLKNISNDSIKTDTIKTIKFTQQKSR